MQKLVAQKRDIFGKKLGSLRSKGLLPAVMYGRGKKNETISVPTSDFMKLWKSAGETSLIDLTIEGEGVKSVLIHEVSFDPVKSQPLHVDFLEVAQDRVVTTQVQLAFVGESLAVKSLGGVLVKVAHEIEIEALPKDLPHEIKVDISSIVTFEDHITIGNLKLPKGVTAIGEADAVLVKVDAPRTDEELASLSETTEVNLENIEVEKKGKEEKEEDSSGEEK